LLPQRNASAGLDILVNNAGLGDFMPLERITEEHFHRHYNVNVPGVILVVKEAVKYMDKRNSCILNIGALSSTHSHEGDLVYGGSNAATYAMTASLALERGPSGIRGNSINPGMVKTEGLDELAFITQKIRDDIAAMTPMRRVGEPGCRSSFLFRRCPWITGQCVRVSAGLI
jgi:3-oxoacyl-[acyl-carrier protein] reductase